MTKPDRQGRPYAGQIIAKRENTLEECKRHIDECAKLLERTTVPEYRDAIIAMGKAWMKIAEQAKKHHS